MSVLNTVPESQFWYFINERHRIYLKKAAGLPKPWTDDPILQAFKFCNVFRELDTGTVWLRQKFTEPHRDGPLDLLVHNTCWYRMFNWHGTGTLLGWQTGWPKESIIQRLNSSPGPVFTGAHLVRSDPGMGKVECIVEACAQLYKLRHQVVKMARETRSLEATFNVLLLVHNVGHFMAYEMVTDLRHTPVLEDAVDTMTWANVGPGAMRGLLRLDSSARPASGLDRMRDLLARSPEHLEAHVPPLELRDVEHALCETDKHCRVMYGEGRPRSRYPGLI